ALLSEGDGARHECRRLPACVGVRLELDGGSLDESDHVHAFPCWIAPFLSGERRVKGWDVDWYGAGGGGAKLPCVGNRERHGPRQTLEAHLGFCPERVHDVAASLAFKEAKATFLRWRIHPRR